MKFFIPHIAEDKYDLAYSNIITSVKEQMRIPVAARKIYTLEYIHDKRRRIAQVGQLDPQQGRYEVFAILEAKPYIVYTRRSDGGAGLTILVSNDEVTTITDFEEQEQTVSAIS